MGAKIEQLKLAMSAHADEFGDGGMDEKWFKRLFAFRQNSGWPIKPPRKSRCSECAADNMYREITTAQRQMPTDLRVSLAARGFCHMTPACACRGECEETGVVVEVLDLYKRECRA